MHELLNETYNQTASRHTIKTEKIESNNKDKSKLTGHEVWNGEDTQSPPNRSKLSLLDQILYGPHRLHFSLNSQKGNKIFGPKLKNREISPIVKNPKSREHQKNSKKSEMAFDVIRNWIVKRNNLKMCVCFLTLFLRWVSLRVEYEKDREGERERR